MTRNAFALVLTLAISIIATPGTAGTGPIVRTEAGVLGGVSDAGINVYRGLPFARPPVGDLRWRDPQPVPAWTGVRSARVFAPACPQTGVSMPGEPPSPTDEDCLYLNVWAPAGAAAGSLPVIVWIPGGGLTNGSTSIPLYDGAQLARRGAVVVTVAYRLGTLGFLAHPDLTAEAGGSGNYGLMDQVAALEWVQDNIGAFGGDSRRVTLAGQSAGATSVSILMASPRARGLFQRAIGQSGGMFEPVELAPRYLLANAEIDGVAYAASLGAQTLAQLRALPVERLLGDGAGRIVHPVIEPRLLPLPPYDAFVAGQQNDVPLLVGFNADEARSLADVSGITAMNFAAELERTWGQLPPPLLAPYAFVTDEEARKARLDFERDLRFGWDVRAWARLQATHGRNPVHVYHFSKTPPYPEGSVQQNWGASHFSELWYMFDHLGQQPWAWTAADRATSEAMADYWVSFARDGDPNGGSRPEWPPFTVGDEQVLRIGDSLEAGVLPDTSGLDVFDAVYSSLRQPRP
ncbi:carboxylesterase family protein [uncultured Brevundimonas sp.]|uniref:carboxylesterase/lipase family protein n=1 Tax=uncultured Brevundimonas sp. TaxID=213418 RepID=UPI0030ED1413|tara:strand:+ start:17534 stop:19090 length:1557 start_codon:yes stop_codon:yes gene_type:complete